jgi:hypothetical protein
LIDGGRKTAAHRGRLSTDLAGRLDKGKVRGLRPDHQLALEVARRPVRRDAARARQACAGLTHSGPPGGVASDRVRLTVDNVTCAVLGNAFHGRASQPSTPPMPGPLHSSSKVDASRGGPAAAFGKRPVLTFGINL